jgi:hypothetical protein
MSSNVDATPASQPTNESPQAKQLDTIQTSTKPKRTAAEQSVIDSIAKYRGVEWAERHADLLIAQAKGIGDLTSDGEFPSD